MDNNKDFNTGFEFIDTFIRRLNEGEILGIVSSYPECLNHFLDKLVDNLKEIYSIKYVYTDGTKRTSKDKKIEYLDGDLLVNDAGKIKTKLRYTQRDIVIIDNVDRFKDEERNRYEDDFSLLDYIYSYPLHKPLILTSRYSLNDKVYSNPSSIISESIDFNFKGMDNIPTYLIIIDDTDLSKKVVDVLIIDIKLKVSNRVRVKLKDILDVKETKRYKELLNNAKAMGLGDKETLMYASSWKGVIL